MRSIRTNTEDRPCGLHGESSLLPKGQGGNCQQRVVTQLAQTSQRRLRQAHTCSPRHSQHPSDKDYWSLHKGITGHAALSKETDNSLHRGRHPQYSRFLTNNKPQGALLCHLHQPNPITEALATKASTWTLKAVL